ncbi:MAG: hypothetical protein KAJ75_07775, partial [Alphaproteobacteria bacterium]|nr:hypothetical protein [Alphaproteobacteria bacterium]
MANKIVQCYLCGRKDAVEVEQNTLDSIIDYEEIYCEENCGKYIISNLDRKKQELQNLSQDKKDKLASYANEFNYDHKGLTLILTNDLSKIYSYETGDYKEKYHQFYRQGKTYDEALYEVAKFIEERRLLKREYQDFEEVISLWEDQAPKDKKRTKPDVVNIMQEFAFLLENKTYIDAAVGTGGILKGLDKNTYIYDNDEKLIEVAKIVRAQYTKYNISPIVSLEQKKDSIASYEVFRFCNLAFFDPPMGDRRVKPEEWDNIYRAGQTQELHSKEVLGDYGKNSQSTTEILFLTNFLITARHDASFIGLFPESILNRNNKEYNSLRKYLVKNSLIAAIKAPSGHVVLVGKKYREGKYKHISVFRMEKLLPREKLKELFEKAIQGKPFEEGDKDKNKYGYIQYSFKELLEDKTCYINLPIVNVNEEPPRPPKEVIDDIKVNEKELEPLKLHIISGEILEYASDVIRLGVTETTDIVKSQWFEKDKNSLLNKFYE